MKAEKKYTESFIREKILTSDTWLVRGILAIYNRQTMEEKNSRCTIVHNGKGFSSAHARLMSYYAQWLKRNGSFTSDHHKERARKVMLRYVRQLARIANENSLVNQVPIIVSTPQKLELPQPRQPLLKLA